LKNSTTPDESHSVQVECWNWFADGWIAIEAALRVEGVETIQFGVFLPKSKLTDRPKLIAVFDGKSSQLVEAERGVVTHFDPILVPDEGLVLNIVCSEAEPGDGSDIRALGAVLIPFIPEREALRLENHVGQSCPPDLILRHPEATLIGNEFDGDFYVEGFAPHEIPQFPMLHYVLVGWRIGRDPSTLFSNEEFMESEYYDPLRNMSPLAQSLALVGKPFSNSSMPVTTTESPGRKLSPRLPDEADLTSLLDIWSEFAGGSVAVERPDFRFDGELYQQIYPDINGVDPLEHYALHGRKEGRFSNGYSVISHQLPHVVDKLLSLNREPRIAALHSAGHPRAVELLYELMSLGEPVDHTVSDFSRKHYLGMYPDIAKAGVEPLNHFLAHGMAEGRHSLAVLRKTLRVGARVFDPSRPTCLITSHDFSRTGAPMVALDLAKEASQTHNVVVAALKDGELSDSFLEYATVCAVLANPYEDLHYLDHPAIQEIEFGILNSVESFPFSKPLVARDIPFAFYIHEYTHYTSPAYKTKLTALYADLLVFSSAHVRSSWAPVFNDTSFDQNTQSAIVPQEFLPRGQIMRSEYQNARSRLSRILSVDCTDRRIIYGAGQIQLRKGTDLFIIGAREALKRDPSSLFVWIGDGHNYEDVSFGAWLDVQMRACKVDDPDGNIFFIPAGPYYHDVCRASDAMFLTSRLDPLPNVVFDAVRYGNHVVLFDEASGFSDSEYLESGVIHSVPYGDVSSACGVLLDLPRKGEKFKKGRGRARAKAIERVSPFDEIRGRLIDCVNASRASSDSHSEAISKPHYDVPVLFDVSKEQEPLRRRERKKVWQMGRRMFWKNPSDLSRILSEEGGWVHARTRIRPHCDITNEEFALGSYPNFGIHIHAFYTDEIERDFKHFATYRHAERIVVTTDSDAKREEILKAADSASLSSVEVKIVRNRGRDILPFLELIAGEAELPDSMVWGHFHQKKSLHATSGDTWRAYLTRILLGTNEYVSSALLEFSLAETGIVAPVDPYAIGWEGSWRLIPLLEARLNRLLPKHPLLFPVGNMFWTRVSVARRMSAVFGDEYPWPNEPIPNDGTVFHAIERLWPAVSSLEGLDSVFLDNPSIVRV
jgi:glycosyltransferase involved in cell wall biosynthesis